jgi:hypothetical protein
MAGDLAAFLPARLDEAEAAGRSPFPQWPKLPPSLDDWEHLNLEMLRWVDAARAILAEHRQEGAGGPCARCATWTPPPPGREWPPGSRFDVMGVYVPWPCLTVRALAAVWRDHPDYDPAWEQ